MNNEALLILACILILSSGPVFGQEDFAGFEVMDNNSIGLTVAPFEKWGTAVADIDRNGWPDLFTIRWASPGYSRLYLNDNGIFNDITDQTTLRNIENQETGTTTVAFVDFDNDGDVDIFPVNLSPQGLQINRKACL